MRRAWDRFWFERRSTAPLELVRIAFGLLALLWALTLLPDAKAFYGPDGILASSPSRSGGWSLLDLWNSDVAAVGLVIALAVAGFCLMIGRGTRVASVVALAVLISLGKRDPFVGNAGDGLLRVLAVYVMLAAFVTAGRRMAPAWPLRLMQVQFSIVYIATVWAKSRGTTWPGGTAVGYAFRLEDLARFPVPDLGSSSLATHVVTYGVLALEASLGVLVWNRRLRPWLLLAGVCLHLGIEYRIRVGFFSWAMLVLYLAWVPGVLAERIQRTGVRLRSRRWPANGLTR